MNIYLTHIIYMVLYGVIVYALLHFFANNWVLAIIFGMTMAILDLKDKNLVSGKR